MCRAVLRRHNAEMNTTQKELQSYFTVHKALVASDRMPAMRFACMVPDFHLYLSYRSGLSVISGMLPQGPSMSPDVNLGDIFFASRVNPAISRAVYRFLSAAATCPRKVPMELSSRILRFARYKVKNKEKVTIRKMRRGRRSFSSSLSPYAYTVLLHFFGFLFFGCHD